MRITVFGANGGTGRQLVQQACASGHQVTAVVRESADFTTEHPLLTVVRADVMDPNAIEPAVRDADAVMSAIGTRAGGETTVRHDSTASIIAAMPNGRIVVISSSGMVTEGDGAITKAIAKPILNRALRHTFADMRRMEDAVRASGLDWTIMRPAMLTNGRRTGTYRTATDRNVRGGIMVSRADLAHAILRNLSDETTFGRSVAIGN